MEKGFNDDELADIMNEIESLEQEFSEDDAGADQLSHEVEESTDSVDEASHDEVEANQTNFSDDEDSSADDEIEVLNDLTKMPEEKVVPTPNVHKLKQAPVSHNHSHGHSSLQFNVEGNMKVELGFKVGGQQINICVNEEDGLVVCLDSGAKFTIPFDYAKGSRKAS